MDTSALAALFTGMNNQPAPPISAPAVQPQASGDPLSTLSNLLSGNGLGDYAQKVGMGMANMREGNDPYVSFANGFGGTSKFTTDQEAAQAKAQQDVIDNQIKANQIAQSGNQFDQRMSQDQSQFDSRQTQDQKQFDESMRVRTAAEKRQDLIAQQAQRKTALEIERLAKNNGLTTDQMLQVEKISQAAAENVVDPAERAKVTEDTRKRLVQQLTSGQAPGEGPGLKANVDGTTSQTISTPEEYNALPAGATFTDPNGNVRTKSE
jgi:hypothetical protein